jgi:hypothetical protein
MKDSDAWNVLLSTEEQVKHILYIRRYYTDVILEMPVDFLLTMFRAAECVE